MGKRRLQVFSDSDEDDDAPGRPDPEACGGEAKRQSSPPEEVAAEVEERNPETGGGGDEEMEEVMEDAKPIGDAIRLSGKGKKRKRHYASFEYDGNVYELDDPVLLTPEHRMQKPYVAIIKDIAQESNGNLVVTGQWFYRPEEATKKGGGNWQTKDARELFYSFHLDEVPAESIMHKCIVHYVPSHKQLPIRSKNPGFIVQKIYDAAEMKLWKLTDKHFEADRNHEIELLVKKTMERLGDLSDIVEDAPVNHNDGSKTKWKLRSKTAQDVPALRDDTTKDPDHWNNSELPGDNENDVSASHKILAQFKALTGLDYRDRWLEKLLQGIQPFCDLKEDKISEHEDMTADAGESVCWPDRAVSAISALEKASHETLGSDFQKYNQKMRQLDFNLKNNAVLARRLLNKELDPLVIITMSPNELKDGLTSEEKTAKEPEMPQQMQMTDARCSRCTQKKVAVTDIIHTGARGDRYQLECTGCGHTWFSSQDAISSLTIDAPSATGNVGTAPWATAKFEDVEKTLASPRESDQKLSPDAFQKSTAAYIPVLETQKPVHKTQI